MAEDKKRRVTDGLELSDQQRAFLDQVIVSVQEAVTSAITSHESTVPHGVVEEGAVAEVVKMTLAAGDFVLPNGKPPSALLGQHEQFHRELDDLKAGQQHLEERHSDLDRNVGRILDVVVGPIKEDFLGDPYPDGERDESLGLMARTVVAMDAAEKLDKHLSNGGVPVKLPAGIKAAIWGAAGTVIAASITAAGLIASAVLG